MLLFLVAAALGCSSCSGSRLHHHVPPSVATFTEEDLKAAANLIARGKAPGDDNVHLSVPLSQAQIVGLAKAVVGIIRVMPGGRSLIKESWGPLRTAVVEGTVQPIVPWIDLAEVDPEERGLLAGGSDDAAAATAEDATAGGAVMIYEANADSVRGSGARRTPSESGEEAVDAGSIVQELPPDSGTESIPLDELLETVGLTQSVRDEAAVLCGLAKGGAISPEVLASWLGKGTLPKRKDTVHRAQLRLAYAQMWSERWLPGYFVVASQRFRATPEAQRAEAGGKMYRGGACIFRRRCGRFLVDAIRVFFTRELRLSGLEPGAIYNLVDTFAHVLAMNSAVKSRLMCAFALVHDHKADKPLPLSDAVLKFAYLTLMVNTEVTKVSARNRKWTRRKVGTECKALTHFPSSLCKQMFDTLAVDPLIID